MGEFADFALAPEQGVVPQMEQLDPEMRGRIRQLAAGLNVRDAAAVQGFGARAQKEMGTFTDIALARMLDRGESPLSGTMQALCEEIRACSFASQAKGLFQRMFKKASSLEQVRSAYEKAEPRINALADEMMAEQKYDEAAALFEACGAYQDAEERTLRALYEKAAALSEAGSYEDAAAAFAVLGSYEDAKLRVTKNEDLWLQKAFNSARMDMEVGDYSSVIEGLSDLWQCDLPERYASIEDMYVDACLERAKALTETGRPLDALPLLESIETASKSAAKRLDA